MVPLALLVSGLCLEAWALPQEATVRLRQIVVNSEEDAADIRVRVTGGTSFEALARQLSVERSSGEKGGYLGQMSVSDLRQEFREAIADLTPGEVSTPVAVGQRYYLFQAVDQAEAEWIALDASGSRALQQGRDAEALAAFQHNLAQRYSAEGRLDDAAQLYESALDILRTALGSAHPATVASVNTLNEFRRALLPDTVERLATIVGLANFKDETFDRQFQGFQDALARTPLGERSYLAIKDALLAVDLTDQAEVVLAHAVKRFSDSRLTRLYLADLLAVSGKPRAALEVFAQATDLAGAPGLDPTADTQQHGFLYQRMGDMHTVLFEFDEAEAAYLQALAIDPENPGGRVALGHMYFDTNRLDQALEEYSRAPIAPEQALDLYSALAEINLSLLRWEEAAAAADKLVELAPSDPQAHFFRGQALVRLGDSEEGQRELREFMRLDAKAQAEEAQSRRVQAILSTGLAAVLRGDDAESAIDIFRVGLESYPEAGEIYMSLALTHRKFGHHLEAAETFQLMIDLGLSDHYLTHKYVAQEYAVLGDLESSERHHAIYLEKRDGELNVVLPARGVDTWEASEQR